jgi:hypothetical protein
MKNLLVTLILIITLASCTKEKQDLNVLIRVQNETGVQIADMRIYSSHNQGNSDDMERNYGNIQSGGFTGYQAHDYVIASYPDISFIHPILGQIKTNYDRYCPVGERIAGPGHYTLIIKQEGSSIYMDMKAE